MLRKTDGQLQRDVMDELEWEPSIDHADIGVAVTDGVVTLSGYVKTIPRRLPPRRRRGAFPASGRSPKRSRFISHPSPRWPIMKSPGACSI